MCYEHDRFDEGFAFFAETFDNELAYLSVEDPMFQDELQKTLTEMQKQELYVYFYSQMLMEFISTFIESPREAIDKLDKKYPGSAEKLAWTIDFQWPSSSSPYIDVLYVDEERRLFRAVKDVVSLLSYDFKGTQAAMANEVELLCLLREKSKISAALPMEYLYILECFHKENFGGFLFLENSFRSFYGITEPPEIVELYEINTIKDLLRFEFLKMVENDILIKKCKNCGHFFIPKRRADAEYCDRIFRGTGKMCSEVGAMRRYEKKVAEDPVWTAYKKAYRRLNSRTRAKKMTQSEFLKWSEQASKKRDECLEGKLPFDDYIAWLEQSRVRKARDNSSQ